MSFAGHAPISNPPPLVLVLLGPPGSGKGTQAVLLKDKFHIPHISTGDLLREHARNGTLLGKQAKEFMDRGQLVPDALILEMLFARVAQPDCRLGYILDGFPRTLSQAKALESQLQHGVIPTVINFEISEKKLIERLTQRLVCEQCGTPYHLISSPPKQKNQCDKCQGQLIQRVDDTKGVIHKRLQVYQDQTAPLIQHYAQQQVLYTIDCDQEKTQIFSQIIAKISHKK